VEADSKDAAQRLNKIYFSSDH